MLSLNGLQGHFEVCIPFIFCSLQDLSTAHMKMLIHWPNVFSSTGLMHKFKLACMKLYDNVQLSLIQYQRSDMHQTSSVHYYLHFHVLHFRMVWKCILFECLRDAIFLQDFLLGIGSHCLSWVYAFSLDWSVSAVLCPCHNFEINQIKEAPRPLSPQAHSWAKQGDNLSLAWRNLCQMNIRHMNFSHIWLIRFTF